MSNTTVSKQNTQWEEIGHKTQSFIVDHIFQILTAIGLLLVIFAGWTIWSQVSESREVRVQEQYFVIDKKFQDTRRQFEEETARLKNPPKNVDTKNPPPAPKKTGDFSKDFGAVAGEFENLINQNPKSKAALMAAISLSNIYAEYGKADEALGILAKVNADNSANSLLESLVTHQRAGLLAHQGKCSEAIPLWNKINQSSKSKYLHQEAQLNLGLCAEQTGDLTAAEKFYLEASAVVTDSENPAANSAVAKDAEKYLRLLKLNKAGKTE